MNFSEHKPGKENDPFIFGGDAVLCKIIFPMTLPPVSFGNC